MELSERAEEMLEQLWLAEEGRGGVDPAADEEAVAELEAAEMVGRRDAGLALTPAGRLEARTVTRRHRLAERLLADVLDVRPNAVESAACRFEHVLARGIDDKVCALLGHPKFCPHGWPIPPGPCCEDNEHSPVRLVASVAEMEPGETGRIAYLHTRERSTLDKLMAMGAVPGAAITLNQRFPSFVLQVGQTQVAVDQDIASSIYVRLAGSAPPRRRRRWGRVPRG